MACAGMPMPYSSVPGIIKYRGCDDLIRVPHTGAWRREASSDTPRSVPSDGQRPSSNSLPNRLNRLILSSLLSHPPRTLSANTQCAFPDEPKIVGTKAEVQRG